MFLPLPPPPPTHTIVLPEDYRELLQQHRRVLIPDADNIPPPVAFENIYFPPSSSSRRASVGPKSPVLTEGRRPSLIDSFKKKKPYTAVSVQIERLCGENFDENDFSGIPELIESIRLQDSGPREASRAIRKKLKYGSVHKQLRALTILDALIANAGKTFQRNFADEPLLERLRIAASDPMTDSEVRAKCKILFGQWAVTYKDTQGLASIAALYRQLPQRARPRPQPRDQSPDGGSHSPPTPASPVTQAGSSSRHRPTATSSSTTTSTTSAPTPARYAKARKDQKKQKPFDLEKEKPALLQSLASVSIAATNLTNSLKHINRETQRPSENALVMQRFEACKVLRRSILRYIQLVESEQYLGSLIHANEELVDALTLFERMDKPMDEDSDSDDEDWNGAEEGMRRLSVGSGDGGSRTVHHHHHHHHHAPPPPPPAGVPRYTARQAEKSREEEEDDDPDNPFGDSNEVAETPGFEKEGINWKTV